MEEQQIISLLQQMSAKVGQMETTLTLKFQEQERTLTRLDSTLSKVDEKLETNAEMTAQHESKIKSLEARVKKLEDNQKWVVTLVLSSVILGLLAKTFGI